MGIRSTDTDGDGYGLGSQRGADPTNTATDEMDWLTTKKSGTADPNIVDTDDSLTGYQRSSVARPIQMSLIPMVTD